MYYPIGWHKVLKLDTTECAGDEGPSQILLVQANHEKELYFILTTKSIHIWFPRPAAEIVCHRRSRESIEKIGLNKTAVWKTDSSVIVVATDRDQLLFYQIRRRTPASSASSFLLLNSTNDDRIYRLKHDPKNTTKRLLNGQPLPSASNDQPHIPALTIYSFGKLDLSSIGISCLMSAEEELIAGARNGEIYGIQWDGNVDDKFPWSLSKEVQLRSDYPVDIKFSSVLTGFAIVFKSGRVGFMPSRLIESEHNNNNNNNNNDLQNGDVNTGATCDTKISYLATINNAICAEINHRHRMVAFGLTDSRTIVCNIGDSNTTLVVNHTLDITNNRNIKNSNDKCSSMGRVVAIQYSPDNFAIAVSWEAGEFALWSVFGSLLFCSQQWKLDSMIDTHLTPVKITSLAWGREGYSLWMCTQVSDDDNGRHQDDLEYQRNLKMSSSSSSSLFSTSNGILGRDQNAEFNINNCNSGSVGGNLVSEPNNQEVMIMSLARCNLSSSPHQTCTSDTIVLIAEEKIYIGPSVPHEDKFDHWICINIPQDYLNSQYPIRYATVDRECKDLAVAGNKGLALYSIQANKWTFFSKKSYSECFSVCGDLIWCNDYLVASCFNFTTESFELRAYKTSGEPSNLDDISQLVIQQIPMEIIRMSIFENRLLVLYSDGTLGMFMMNLRRRPKLKIASSLSVKSSNSTVVGMNNFDSSQQLMGTAMLPTTTTTTREQLNRSTRSDSIVSWSNPRKNSSLFDKDLILQISPIENLIISNLQANPFCISSIALTKLHFKNYRTDDSILLNACGKLFLLEREAPPGSITGTTTTTNSGSSPCSSSPTSSDLITTPTPTDLNSSSSTNTSNNKDHTSSLENSYRSVVTSSIGLNNLAKFELKANSAKLPSNSAHLASASLRNAVNEPGALSNVTFKAVSVIATNVEQFWISPEISMTPNEMSYFKKSLWLSCGTGGGITSNGSNNTNGGGGRLQIWLPLLNDKHDAPTDLYVPDRIMLPIRCDIYPLAIRSSAPDILEPDDAIVLGAECDVLYRDCKLFSRFPYATVKRQCRVYLHRILRELLLSQHLGYYAKKIAESCQSLPYFAHCFELLLHEVLEEEATSPVPLPDPMLPQVVKFIRQFPQVYLETVVHCARKSELSMWSHLFDERAVGNPRRLFQECIDQQKYDIAVSCLIILQSLDKNVVSSRMIKELIRLVSVDPKFDYLVEDLENFLTRAGLDSPSLSVASGSPISPKINQQSMS